MLQIRLGAIVFSGEIKNNYDILSIMQFFIARQGNYSEGLCCNHILILADQSIFVMIIVVVLFFCYVRKQLYRS